MTEQEAGVSFDPGRLLWSGTMYSDDPKRGAAQRARGNGYTIALYEQGGVCSCTDYILRGIHRGLAYIYQCKHIVRARRDNADLLITAAKTPSQQQPRRARPPTTTTDPYALDDDDLTKVARRRP